MSTVIHYASAPCGSGKTFQIIRKAVRLANDGETVLIALPTIELVDRVFDDPEFKKATSPPVRVHGNTVEERESVLEKLIERMNDAETGQIILITHTTLLRLSINMRRGWDLIVDEVPQVFRTAEHRLPKRHSLLTDNISFEQFNAGFDRIVLNDRAALEEIGKNAMEDDVDGTLAETARMLTDRHRDTFVNVARYKRLTTGTGTGELLLHSILQPSIIQGFKSVFIAAANFEHSAMYKLWSQNSDVSFRGDEQFTKSLRFDRHDNGDLITIYYATERDWSKSFMGHSLDDTKRTVWDAAVNVVRGLYGEDSFVWQGNKRFPDDLFGQSGTRLPNMPHGLNTYDHINRIAFLSALNAHPETIGFLKTQGMDSHEIRTCGYLETVYQSVMRISIRNPGNTEPKFVFVPDRSAAEWLQQHFPGSTVQRIESEISEIEPKRRGRPRQHNSDAGRMRKKRKLEDQQKRQSIINAQIELEKVQYDLSKRGWDTNFSDHSCSETPLYIENKRTLFVASLFASQYEERSSCKKPLIAASEFADLMRQFHQRSISSKQTDLVSPAIFDPDKSNETSKGLENVLYAGIILLDFEYGDLKPDEFASILPNLEMIITNSYHHTPEKPRFHVMIFTKSAMTADTYRVIYNQIDEALEVAGYKRKPEKHSNMMRSGLDWSKRPASSQFFVPSRAKRPEHSFFHHYTDGREPLDPLAWLQHTAFKPEDSAESFPAIEPAPFVNQTLLDSAVQNWRNAKPGEGNHEFYMLALRLRRAGLGGDKIRAKLQEEAAHAKSPSERRAQIAGIMKSLAKAKRNASVPVPADQIPLSPLHINPMQPVSSNTA